MSCFRNNSKVPKGSSNRHPGTIKTIVVLLALILPGLSLSQDITITTVPFPDNHPTNTITGITQDKNGYIWMSSINTGLIKYDGINWKTYRPDASNVNSITASWIECVYADSKGIIWAGNNNNGLDRLDPDSETFTHFEHDPDDPSSLRSNAVSAILEDREGSIWIGTVNGLDRLDEETGRFEHIEGDSDAARALSNESVRALYEDREGSLWVGCSSPFFEQDPNIGGLYKINKASGEITRYQHEETDETSLINNTVRAIFEDSRGVLWVGTAGDGLHIMDREKGTFRRCTYDPKNPHQLSRPPVRNVYGYALDHITFINEDAYGYVWIGTFSGGLTRINPNTLSVQHYGTEEKVPYTTVRNDYWFSLKTRDNLLWITTWLPRTNTELLLKISPSYMLDYTTIGNPVLSFAQGTDSALWIGTNRGGLIKKSTNNSYDSVFVPGDKNGNENVILDLEPDPNNNLWVSTAGGLYFYDTRSNSFKDYRRDEKIANSLSSDFVFKTQLNDDGTIWIGTDNGLDLMDIETGSIENFKHDPEDSTSIPGYRIQAMEVDKGGNTWIGTPRGLSRYDKDKLKFGRILDEKFKIGCIFEDSEELIWIGTLNSGLYVFNPQSQNLRHYRDSTNIIRGLNIWGITEDKGNFLWLNTELGFIKLNTKTKYAEIFGRSWNVDTRSVTDHGFTTLKGEVLFGDRNGYYHFDPSDLENKGTVAQPFISRFILDNSELVPGSDEISLDYDQNNFAFEFDNLDFVTKEPILLYKLDNYEDNWRSGENKAYYYNVEPGKYVFRVKAGNMFGKWGEKSITLIIATPWYNTWWAYILYGLIFIGGVFSVDRFQRKRLLEKAELQAKKKELEQAKEIEKAYTELKSTQQQLIHSEKMASLGELTAGIAHEIQNPLNFINNFSDVNKELVEELREEIKKGNGQEAEAILKDIEENEEKILHHGKRADGIVKGMLQHSRSGGGEKEPTDINELADEYLRLAYHGLRAKDKSFNADFKTEFDPNLPKVNVVPQDIGRVLLNLINNAFYAVSERENEVSAEALEARDQNSEADPSSTSGPTRDYKPQVILSTRRVDSPLGAGGSVEISIQDNGPGVPDEIKDKIFQPFFTTKSTGEGTGLGLSLSYDIVTKGHGGTIDVASVQGEGTEFIISLPLS